MFAHLTDAKRLLMRSHEERMQTRIGDRLSMLTLGEAAKTRVGAGSARRAGRRPALPKAGLWPA